MEKTQFQKAIEAEIKCDLCGAPMLAMYGYGWDNDRMVCGNRDCGGEVVYPTSTEFKSATDAVVPRLAAESSTCEADCSELLARLTAAMREADAIFMRAGGSTRHHVRDCLIPVLEKHGLKLVCQDHENLCATDAQIDRNNG